MPGQVERRYITPVGLELRAVEGQKHPILAGLAAVFNSPSENLGGFREIMLPGAFKKALKDPNLEVYSLFNHDPDNVLGATANGSLRMQENEKGLYQETDMLGDTTISRDVEAHVRTGRIHKMSFAFTVAEEEYKVEKNQNIRYIPENGVLRLYDVSPVTYPAYRATELHVRSLQEDKFQEFLPALIRAEKNLPTTKEDLDQLKALRELLDKILTKQQPANVPDDALRLKARIALLL